MNAVPADPVLLLQRLIRFRSVNPPGEEGPCVAYVADLLRDAGIDVRLLARDQDRPNLVARIPGRGLAPPLLLHAHADVVPVEGQDWTVPPFEGRLSDGHVWGRGAIDMKGGLAMMLSALTRLRADGEDPAGDVLVAVSPDEETGSEMGARYLVDHHAELFDGVRYAIGEDGGAIFGAGGRRWHPVVVAEKRACWMRATLRGRGGHASRQGWSGTAMAALTRMLGALQTGRLPAHATPAFERMAAELAAFSDGPLAGRMKALIHDPAAEVPYDLLPEADAVYLDSVIRNTANATIVRTSDKINMLPTEITVDIDGRILPGEWSADDYLAELRTLIGPEPEIEVLLEGRRSAQPVFGTFYDSLVSVLREKDPDGVPLPMMTPASTDARLFAGLGIACYGWLPLLTSPGSRYQDTMHAADERVPVEAVRFGADCVHRLLSTYR
ncbi:M20/M25/M40 family metallo-hydrolase [Nonomuraea fuscirosea]|uniref:M20/M25/M40 family metallo-hydrolase n=1 Tax=Nonomuraea fuscirosea TaxID=1291556 RepID=UPI0034094B92